MARGPSGRLVIEVDPNLKHALHAALAADGLTLKKWFIQRMTSYISEQQQPFLPSIKQFRQVDDESSFRAAETPIFYREHPNKSKI